MFFGNGPGHIRNRPGYLGNSPGELRNSPANLTELENKEADAAPNIWLLNVCLRIVVVDDDVVVVVAVEVMPNKKTKYGPYLVFCLM